MTFLLIPAFSFAQDLQKNLQGTWLCVDILNAAGKKTHGEFGGPLNFLKFQFEGEKLFVSVAPFDKGYSNRIVFNDDYFELVNANHKQYNLRKLTGDSLILETINQNKRPILYHFINSNVYTKDVEQVSNIRQYDRLTIAVTYIRPVSGYYLTSGYLIDNTILNRLPCPTFVDKQNISLGAFLEKNLQVPFDMMVKLSGKETSVAFDVTSNGVENISIETKLGDEVDFRLYDVINATDKKWQPLIVNGKTIDIRMRLKIAFSFVEK